MRFGTNAVIPCPAVFHVFFLLIAQHLFNREESGIDYQLIYGDQLVFLGFLEQHTAISPPSRLGWFVLAFIFSMPFFFDSSPAIVGRAIAMFAFSLMLHW